MNSARTLKVAALEQRLARYFGEDWKVDWSVYRFDIDQHLGVHGAQVVFKKLANAGSNLDLEIFSTYLSVKELAVDDYELGDSFYFDRSSDERPKSSLFQARHWDWGTFDGYFFNSPSLFSHIKKQDLKYLEHVERTAREVQRRTLREIVGTADRSWHLMYLTEREPELARGFVEAETGRFERLAINWIESEGEAGLLLASRLEWARATLNESRFALDNWIASEYLARMRGYKLFANGWRIPVDLSIQLTDERAFDGLATASIDYLIDFLFQNSHDTLIKAYLLKILWAMNPTGDGPTDFASAFLYAKTTVDQSMDLVPAPSELQTDLNVFTISGYQAPDQAIHRARVYRVRTNWSERFGRLQTNVVSSASLNDNQTVASISGLKEFIDTYFDYFLTQGTYPAPKVEAHRAEELQAPISRSTFFIFTDPSTGELVGMMRIFNGSDLGEGEAPLYLERELTGIKLPAREARTPVREFGRLLTTRAARAGALPIILARAADYLENTRASGLIYLDGEKSATQYYERSGARVIFEPSDLPLAEGDTPIWVLDVPVSQILNQFSRPTFETIRLRPARSIH